MRQKKQIKKKMFIISFFMLILFEFNFIFTLSLSETRIISGTQVYDDIINPNQTVIYNFSDNNILFGISTDSEINMNLDIGSTIFSRESFIIVNNNNNSIFFNCSLRSNIEQYDMQQKPKGPLNTNFQYRYSYNNIIRIRTNTTIQNLTIQFRKSPQFGLGYNLNYRIGIFENNLESWAIVPTYEKINQSNTEPYIEGEILNLEGEQDYFITIFEIINVNYNWIWISIVSIAIALFAIIIVISKREYIHLLRTRIIPIDKGVHNLTLDDVLENENRNKLIDLILNEPGIHFNELLRRTNLSAGNLAWHLDILETYKIIGKKRFDHYLVYFPYYQKNPISNIDLKLQKSELTIKILEMIENNPGIYNQKLAIELGVDHKTITYHVNKLVNLELISIQKQGRKKKFFPNLDAEYFLKNHETDNN